MNSSPSKQFGCRINITNNAAVSLYSKLRYEMYYLRSKADIGAIVSSIYSTEQKLLGSLQPQLQSMCLC